MFRKIAYWAALVFSTLFLIAGTFAIIVFFFAEEARRDLSFLTAIIPAATLFVTAIGTFSAVFYGWRIDRRQARESELKIKELEIKIEQMLETQRKAKEINV